MSFRFDVNSPAAKKLGEQVFQKIKELWDPALKDDSVAQYAVALVARGGDRKKIFSNLKGLLGDEATNLLLDWLLKHVKTHRNELTTSTASTAVGKPSKKDSSKQKAASAQASASQAPGKETEAPAQPVVDDVEELLREGEDDEDDQADAQAATTAAVDTAHSASHQKDNEDAVALQTTASTQNNKKAASKTSSQTAVKPSNGKTTAGDQGTGVREKDDEKMQSAQPRRSNEQPQATQQPQPTGKKQRMRSTIQWVAPSATAAETSTQPDDSAAEARKARFHEADEAKHDSRRSRDGTRDRERDRIRHNEQHVSPGRHVRDRSRSPGYRDRGNGRTRSPVSLRGREPERQLYNEQGYDGQRYTGRAATLHDSHRSAHTAGHYQDIDPRDHSGGSFWDRDGFRHPGPVDTIPRHSPPPAELPTSPIDGRPRLRSAVSGNADLNQQLEAAAQERQPDRVLGAGRLLGQSLARAIGGGGSVFSRIKRPGKPADADQTERQPIKSPTAQVEHRSVFERTKGKRAASHEPDVHVSETAAVAGSDHHVRPAAKLARGTEQLDKSSRQPPQQSTADNREAVATTTTVPSASKGVAVEQQKTKNTPQDSQRQKPTVLPGINGTAASSHQHQPAHATAAKQTHTPANAGSSKPAAAPSGGIHKPAAAAKSLPEPEDEMTKLMEELKRKELEINRMKGQLAIQQGSTPASIKTAAATAGAQQHHATAAAEAAKRAEADSRSVVVQNLHFGATEELLKTHFSFCGPVTRVTILRDKMTQLPYGSGYVEFVTLEGKQRALELNNSMFLNQMIRVFPKPARIMTAMPGVVTSKVLGAGIAPAGPKRLADAAPLAANGTMTWRRPTGQPTAS